MTEARHAKVSGNSGRLRPPVKDNEVVYGEIRGRRIERAMSPSQVSETIRRIEVRTGLLVWVVCMQLFVMVMICAKIL